MCINRLLITHRICRLEVNKVFTIAGTPLTLPSVMYCQPISDLVITNTSMNSVVLCWSQLKARSILVWLYPVICHGVPISPQSACTKANQKLGFIKRNLKSTPHKLKRLSYVAFIRSGMEYASIIWDPHFIKDSDALERVQRRVACWITSKHDRGTSVTALLHQLHLEPLEERRHISRLTFLYKILNEHVAMPMNQLDLVLCVRPVRGSTTKQRLKIPRCATTQFQKSFAARTITEWNSLPDSITSLASVSSFGSQLSATSCP